MIDLPAIAPGQRIGPYVVHHEIGRGATAIVLLAEDPAGQQVAVKTRRRGVPASDRRFLREFESMRALRMPGVVRVFEAGISDELVWFSMEYVEGETFLDGARDAPSDTQRVDRVLDLGCQLLDVLTRLHAAGLAHRDIKPSNVLVDDRGRVQVLDFGIGRFFDRGSRTSDDGAAVGTMPYMAPEQLAGLGGDAGVDTFATGLMIYEALAAERPAPSNPLGWITRTCLERLTPLASQLPFVPRRLSHTVERLLDVDPRSRITARDAAVALRQVRTTVDSQDWPEPPFVEPEPWWGAIESALGHPTEPFMWVLDGPAGSGRRRAVEQLQRQALIQGIRTLHVRCDATRIGGPMLDAVQAVLGPGDDEAHVRAVVGGGGGALRQMWPHLPLPPSADREPVPTMTRVAEASAGVLARAAARDDLLLVVHCLEQIDLLSARALHRLAVLADRTLSLVLLHDPRWQTELSRQVIGGLQARRHAQVISLSSLPSTQADALRAAVCPAAPPTGGGVPPQRAVEEAYTALARWRGEPWTTPGAHLWPLAVIEPIPERVLTDLVGASILDSPWVRREQDGVVLSGATARRAARSRLADLARAAAAIALSWEQALGDDASPEPLVSLHLLAGAPQRARTPAARAALQARNEGRYADARRWLFLHDTLPYPAGEPLDFAVALARAQVALVTEAEEPRDLLVNACETAATTPEQRCAAAIVQAHYQLRQGQIRPALVAALRIASPSRAPSPELASHALILASRCRLRLGQFADAQAQLTRAGALIAGGAPTYMTAGMALLRAEVLLATEDLDAAGAQAEALLLQARRKGQLHDAASAGLVLSRVLRLVGRRGRAESLARAAAVDAGQTGDLELDAQARLHLATLLVERGDAASARPYLDAAIRRLRMLRADHVLPRALRVVLQAAISDGDPHNADMALGPSRGGALADPEGAAVAVRWWRSRGEHRVALQVDAPTPGTWASMVWHIERARTRLAAGQHQAAAHEAGQARVSALERGFDELELYARLIEQAASPTPEAAWAPTYRDAAASVWTDLCFCALELQARRHELRDEPREARAIWQALRARCEELGYRPGYEEALGWLSEPG